MDRIKFIPHADFYVHNPTTLTALFKCLLIETEEDKVKYSEDLQREYSDETNRKKHNVKNAVRSNTRVSELVFFLPFKCRGQQWLDSHFTTLC